MIDTISKLIQDFAKKHLQEKEGGFHATRNSSKLTVELTSLLQEKLKLNDIYKVYASVGRGAWSEIPWLAILDQSVTSSTMNGYYIVILFDRELKNIYLDLAVGWTQFLNEYGTIDGREKVRGLCDYYASILKNKPAGFNGGPIKLNAKRNLGKGYEAGAIISKKHAIESIESEKIFGELKSLLKAYNELKELVGNSILNIEIDEANYSKAIKSFKKKIASASFKNDSWEAIEDLLKQTTNEPPKIRIKLRREIARNRKFAQAIKAKAKYICEICGRKPFMQKNGQPYAEADHIQPLGGKERGLDNPENMRCLCSQCHAIITHGSETEVEKLMNSCR